MILGIGLGDISYNIAFRLYNQKLLSTKIFKIILMDPNWFVEVLFKEYFLYNSMMLCKQVFASFHLRLAYRHIHIYIFHSKDEHTNKHLVQLCLRR